MKHDADALAQYQSLPLNAKVRLTQMRIKQALLKYDGNCYLAFSGGKDSTVLKHILDEMGVRIPAVFVNTGLEWPEVRRFAQAQPNVVTITPKLKFAEVIERYGYPVVSKEQANYIHDYRTAKSEHTKHLRLYGNRGGHFKISAKWRYLIDAPFKISHMCCNVLKKAPSKAYEKATGRVPFIATLAAESNLRKNQWIKYGCNAFDATRPTSRPLSIWTEQDILEYIVRYKVPIASIYGEVVTVREGDTTKLKLTGEQRTGCMYCMFGVHLEHEPNKFQRMHASHPKQWNYCINTLGCGRVLDTIKVKYI